MATTRKSSPRSTSATTDESADKFTDEEQAAIKERAKELRAAKRSAKEDQTEVVADKIAELPEPDRELAERVHAVITAGAPSLAPRLWYGMPAYAAGGKVVCFFQPASKFKARYATLGFNDPAQLDEGEMWATAFAVTELTPAVEKQIRALVRKAAGEA